ncbi:hypothetical protein CYMTET_48996 [Cymbomonas tetramitiformis]|uniref:Fe2OG dioxygenase domain-containing protein n=1 Tax=Cymbomonas tetramitiformis TaxID=36881 RepID=A0AAE0BS72_9CHLO|nr:hypothetical protein CYMTET_48996 [Cymbomonas tetramitiformis]
MKPVSQIWGEKVSGKQEAEAVAACNTWLSETDGEMKLWFEDLQDTLQQSLLGSPKSEAIVKVRNVLPAVVAEGALALIRSVPEEDWSVTQNSLPNGSAKHRFRGAAPADSAAVRRGLSSTGLEQSVSRLFQAFASLMAGSPFTFQLGRYTQGDFISPHNDAAQMEVSTETTGKRDTYATCSRDIAVIFYLTKSWDEADGGCFIDHATGDVYVPEFNSLIAFRVPRLHSVTPVKVRRPRYSIFGWFLRELSNGPCKKRKQKGTTEVEKFQQSDRRHSKARVQRQGRS